MIRPTSSLPLSALVRDRAPGRTDTAAPRAPEKSGASGTPDLSAQEKAMIDDRFPASKRMTLRLYGPARPAGQMPDGIGSNIDLRG